MRRVTICTVAAATAALITVSTAFAADGPNLDVAGIKIGMDPKTAIAALKADNPRFKPVISSLTVEGFSAPLHPGVTAMVGGTPTDNAEEIDLLFTMPPNKEQLWGVKRVCNYRPDTRPSSIKTVEALRAKYGPESIYQSPGPSTVNLTWVFDADGKLIPADKAKPVWMSCTSFIQNHFGSDIAALNDFKLNPAAHADCGSIILITANVQATAISPGSQEYVVYNLLVQINHGPMYWKALPASRDQAMGAAKARENKEIDDVNKRGTPKL